VHQAVRKGSLFLSLSFQIIIKINLKKLVIAGHEDYRPFITKWLQVLFYCLITADNHITLQVLFYCLITADNHITLQVLFNA